MSLKRFIGTNEIELGKFRRWTGTNEVDIGKITRWNGVNENDIYLAEEVVFPGYTFTARKNYSTDEASITSSRLYVHVTPANDGRSSTNAIVYTNVDFTGFDKLTIKWSTQWVGAWGALSIGYTSVGNGDASFSTVNLGSANLFQGKPTVTGKQIGNGGSEHVSGTSGTLELDISKLSGVYEVGMAAVSRTTADICWIDGTITSIMLT